MTGSVTTNFRVMLLSVVLAAGCAREPIGEPIHTNNPDLQLAFMFEHEGCRVYRFYDQGYARYFSDCRGSVSGGENHTCGKGCSSFKPNEVETVE
jgi:hypothetical protein